MGGRRVGEGRGEVGRKGRGGGDRVWGRGGGCRVGRGFGGNLVG